MRSMKSSCDVIHDASNLLDVRPACVVELSVARFARTKDQTAHGTWPRKHSVHGLVAQKRRAGVLATAGARAWPTLHARGRAVCRTVRIMTRTTRTCPNIRDLILKCTNTHESAQLGLGTQICVIMLAIYWLWRRAGENRNQTIKCRTKIKQSNTTCNTTIPYHPEKESKQSKYR